jgi:hypothetical protein
MRGIEIAPPIGTYHRDIGTHESLALAEADALRVFGKREPRVTPKLAQGGAAHA